MSQYAIKDVESGDAPNEEEKEESKIQQRKCVINPNGDFCKNWDLLMVALLIFTAIVTPFEVGFLTPKFDGLYVVNRFVDSGFVADMFVNFFLGYLSLIHI